MILENSQILFYIYPVTAIINSLVILLYLLTLISPASILHYFGLFSLQLSDIEGYRWNILSRVLLEPETVPLLFVLVLFSYASISVEDKWGSKRLLTYLSLTTICISLQFMLFNLCFMNAFEFKNNIVLLDVYSGAIPLLLSVVIAQWSLFENNTAFRLTSIQGLKYNQVPLAVLILSMVYSLITLKLYPFVLKANDTPRNMKFNTFAINNSQLDNTSYSYYFNIRNNPPQLLLFTGFTSWFLLRFLLFTPIQLSKERKACGLFYLGYSGNPSSYFALHNAFPEFLGLSGLVQKISNFCFEILILPMGLGMGVKEAHNSLLYPQLSDYNASTYSSHINSSFALTPLPGTTEEEAEHHRRIALEALEKHIHLTI